MSNLAYVGKHHCKPQVVRTVYGPNQLSYERRGPTQCPVSIRLGVGPQPSFTRANATWEVFLSTNLIHYLPVITTFVAIAFFRVLWKHWQANPSARYVMWWMIGVGLYGLGTFTEAATTIFGWSEPVFRTWYVAGALLGGAPLAKVRFTCCLQSGLRTVSRWPS